MSTVAILDFGAQYTKVIDRKVRELSVESIILPADTPASTLKQYDALILSGGPHSVFAKDAPVYDSKLFTLGKPLLGICYGMQLLNQVLGGSVVESKHKEYGETTITVTPQGLFLGLTPKQQVLMSHGDVIERVAPGFQITGKSGKLVASIANEQRKLYGVQFHPEVHLTTHGKEILGNFLFHVAGLKATYTLDYRLQQVIADLKKKVGRKKVLVLVSGGVDSAVTAALLLHALPQKQVHAVHVDHGFMRKGESLEVCKALQALGLQHLHFVEAREQFIHATAKKDHVVIGPLMDEVDPERKRAIIGDTFMQIVQESVEALNLPSTTLLAQGTLRPDLIESASSEVSGNATTIKTHHNDTGLVREKREKGLVIEPNKDWHKDEVREVGRRLGLPEDIVQRQPFPGPGLAVRILCAREPYVAHYQDVQKAVGKHTSYDAKVLPIRSVGVQGDHRSYRYPVVISGKGNWKQLRKTAQSLPRNVHEVNRVVYLFEKQLSRIHFTPTLLGKESVRQLQEAEAIVHKHLLHWQLIHHISQVPVILLPVGFGIRGRSVVLRPFITDDFMTGRPAAFGTDIPIACLKAIVQELYGLPWCTGVLYDLTSKPPGTVEWE